MLTASTAMMGSVGLLAVSVIDLMTIAPAIAPVAIPSMDRFEPKRAIASPPVSAPTTPPML